MKIQEQDILSAIDQVGNRANGAAARALKQIFGEDEKVELAIRAVMTTYGNLGFRGEIKLMVGNILKQAQAEQGRP